MVDEATPRDEVKGLLLHTNGQCLPISVPKDSIDEIQQYLACDVFTTIHAMSSQGVASMA